MADSIEVQIKKALAKRDELERKLKKIPEFTAWLAVQETIRELERMAE
jgi:hypothetical protein